MLTEVTVTLDHFALQAIKMGLGALSVQAQRVSENIDAQVQAAVNAENAKDEQSIPVRDMSNGHAESRS